MIEDPLYYKTYKKYNIDFFIAVGALNIHLQLRFHVHINTNKSTKFCKYFKEIHDAKCL